MRNSMTYRRRAATGLAVMTAGAASLVVGIAGPASAHGKQEPEPAPNGKTCAELADLFEIDQEWTELKITDIPEDDTPTTFVLDDRGTEDEGDDATVTVTIDRQKYVAWESNIGIDAVYVSGENHDQDAAFYIYAASADDEEETSDNRLGTNPWDQPDKNKLEQISFCFDEEHETPPTTAPPTSETPSTAPPSSEVPTTEAPTTSVVDTTAPPTSEVEATTVPPTTTPPTTEAPGGNLPHTGSNTGLLVAIGAGLLLIGGALVASKRQIWKRFAR
jgi:LPXTG-motif cell wall-anchored protein